MLPEPGAHTFADADALFAWRAENDGPRLEMIDGHLVAQATGTYAHSNLIMRLFRALDPLVRLPCILVIGDSTGVITASRTYGLIPDLALSCDERDVAPADRQKLAIFRHPRLVIEVASRSTRQVDYVEKAAAYGSIAECDEYLIIDSWQRSHRAWRRSDGLWLETLPSSLNALYITSLDAALSVDELYDGIV